MTAPVRVAVIGCGLVAQRSHLTGQLSPTGCMAVAFGSESDVLEAVDQPCEALAVAAVNAPDVTVVSGESHAVEELCARLVTAMSDEFQRELERSMQRIRDALAPYNRFVRSERDSTQRFHASMQELLADVERLRGRVQKIEIE